MNQNNGQNSTNRNVPLYIGLMCGTSIDGVDVALVDFGQVQCELIDSYLHPINPEVKAKLRSLCSLACAENHLTGFEHRIELLGELDNQMGYVFAEAVNHLLKKRSISKDDIGAIGSHGQTIRHQPAQNSPFTLQIGDPNIIAHQTGIQTVSDFRRMDMAAGGQGAPLAPAFHNAAMRSQKANRIILNLGGIANITLLPKKSSQSVIGFDTGTANTLLDVWYMHNHPHAQDDFDRDSHFALQGTLQLDLLEQLLSDPYFQLPPPKSTGREYFSIEWLFEQLQHLKTQYTPADIQRTLLELTAVSVSNAILGLNLNGYEVYTCGGGTHNPFLIERLEVHLKTQILPTDVLGISGDYLEAMTFAWLAHQRVNQLPGNLPSVTGAKGYKVLGAIYHP
ncbi:anhydro-N-acetylmuramic acid kinase [Aliikangiella sp. IMCC44359]|uniref:anhydro-N-acetylmuramic acid kinase n=1 Tax=Aliikangiella sp. IMCC44359 TaxID=3459125 RepID=UPI00403B0271